MANETPYLDYTGLTVYNQEVTERLGTKVDKVTGKQLSDENFTAAEKTKLEGLTNYTLTAANGTTLGGVMVAQTTDPIPEKTALKADPNGKAFVDWAEAPNATQTSPGLVKLGTGLKVNADTGAVEIDAETAPTHDVSWTDIQNKPDIALKSDITSMYQWKGSVANYDALPTTDVQIGWVYNTEDTGMNYGWTGTGWDALGQVFHITPITAEQIRALFSDSTQDGTSGSDAGEETPSVPEP